MKVQLKKFVGGLTAVLTFVLSVFPSMPPAALGQTVSFQFHDVNSSTSYVEAILWAYDQGIIQGYSNGNFGPDDCVRRSELVKMLVEYAHTGSSTIGEGFSDPGFRDVFTSDWYYPYVKEAKSKNYIQGYSDNTFRPNNCVNRAEAMKIAYQSLLTNQTWDSSGNPVMYDDKVVTDIPVSSWYAPYARALFRNRLMGTVHTVADPNASTNYRGILFYPAGSMTRKEVAEMLYRISKFSGTNPPAVTLGTPILNYPSNNSSFSNSQNMTMNFAWTAATGATYYDLMIRLPQSSTYFMTQRTNTTGSSYTFNIQGSTQGYYWKVRAFDGKGNSKDSAESYFDFKSMGTSTVEITYQSPTTSYTSMPSQINFQWSTNVADSTLVLEYRDPNNMSSVVKTSRFSGISGISRTLYSADYQNDFMTYRTFCWKLEKSGTNYHSSTNGYPCVSYNLSSAPTAPTLIFPSQNLSYPQYTTAVTFQIVPSNASSYQLGIQIPGNQGMVWWDVSSTPGQYGYLYKTVYKGDANFLSSQGTYTWMVRAYNLNKTSYTDTSLWSFYVQGGTLPPPSLLNPTSDAVYNNFPRNVTFQWTSVSNSSKYELEVGCDYCSGGSKWSNPSVYETTGTSLVKTMPGSNDFRYRVRAIDASGSPGVWSDYRYFSYSI